MPIKFLNDVAVDSSVLYVDTINNRVGVGTSSPSETFTLQTQGDGLGNEGIFIKNPFAGTTPIVNSKSPFLSLATSTTSAYNSTIYMGRNATATDQESKIEWSNANNGLSIYVKGTGTYREHVRFGNISSGTPRTYFGGNVGIGTTSPGAKLDVDGNLRINTNNLTLSTNPSWGVPTQNIIGAEDNTNGATLTLMNTSATIPAGGVSGTLQFVALDDARNNGGSGYATASISAVSKLAPGSGQSGQGALVFKTGGYYSSISEKMRIDHLGNVGIGTTSPQQKLDVNGDIAIKTATQLSFNTSNGTLSVGGHAGQLDLLSSSIFINYTGDVGIGTTSPAEKLAIDGSIRMPRTEEFYWTDGSVNGNPRAVIFSTSNEFGGDYNGIGFSIGANGRTAPSMYIRGTGNVGIGTTSPSNKLDVNGNIEASRIILPTTGTAGSGTVTVPAGKLDIRSDSTWSNSAIIARSTTNQNPVLAFYRPTGSAANSYPWWLEANGSSFHIKTGVSANIGSESVSAKVTINSNGNVGIGTTSPSEKLHVSSNDQSTARIRLSNTNTGSGGDNIDLVAGVHNVTQDGFSVYNATSNQTQLVIQGGGNVGIGTTSPAYQLQLSTNSAAKPTSSAWTVVSDERVKTNIRPYETGLQELLQIEPKLFDYNGKAGFDAKTKNNIGVIAQEIKDVMPETVKKYNAKLNEEDEEDTELYNFDSHALTFALINSVKELNAKIKNLETKIQTLENQ